MAGFEPTTSRLLSECSTAKLHRLATNFLLSTFKPHELMQRIENFEKASSTQRTSQAVPHPSTDRALQRLTSEFGRDPVYSLRYGR